MTKQEIFNKTMDQRVSLNICWVKIFNVTTWLINIAMHILTNISRNKGDQTMKFCQLLETFPLKSRTQSVVEKLFPDLFLKS